MPYDWEKNGSMEPREGTQEYAEKVPDGKHDLEITRIVFGKKDNPPFVSRKGDPQIMIIFSDQEGREVNQMITLSASAGFILAQILSAAGADVRKMTASNVKLVDFAAEDFANTNLIGRKIQAQVLWDAKGYATVTPIRKELYEQANPEVTQDVIENPQGQIPF